MNIEQARASEAALTVYIISLLLSCRSNASSFQRRKLCSSDAPGVCQYDLAA